ncbi:MAG: M1 family metallopeptidase [Ignavibacteriae bacterium]|nr:M1 family metallopeptidase [Ignavibacteriota bacterium]
MKSHIRFICAVLLSSPLFAQQPDTLFTRADSLRGMLSPERTCYDVRFYHLDVRVDPADSSLRGSNDIVFDVVRPFTRMQVDLFANMKIDGITLQGSSAKVSFTREADAVFIDFPNALPAGSRQTLRIAYSGKPIVAKRPPWDGGFSWDKDKSGRPWVMVTCQGTGASLWWPTKDHQEDEPDSMMISITVPPGLTDISNGRLRSTEVRADGWTRYNWFVSYPINTYSVTVNIGNYAHFADTYQGKTPLTLDYYVLPENLEKAKAHFAQVKPMMACFERFFGPYPFPRDGYKLVECSHTGMEHQSAVAYGNWYIGGYRGRAPSEAGLKFDFIIIHESAHEWWGNAITAKDVADMWIHESFGAYAEALFVEYQYGYAEALKYVNGKKPNVGNRSPIIGTFNVAREGSGDMYDKGQLVLNTLRSVIDNDLLWFSILRGLMEKFSMQTVTGEDITGYIAQRAGTDLGYFFDQYLRFPKIPLLEVSSWKKGPESSARYRWRTDVKGFTMPIRVTTGKGQWGWITPTTEWQTMSLGGLAPEDFEIEKDRFYVDVRLNYSYLDPATPEMRRR